jgi:[ribosomal protein S5]-alanine N-acetyltransferase
VTLQSVSQADVVATTERLRLRRIHDGDAAFLLSLLNQPTFLRFIGDKGVRTADDAISYIRNGPLTSYAQYGFGLYMVELKETSECVGTCGILKKPALTHPDIGFAFMPEFWSQGYAFEAASATIEHARESCGLEKICAVVDPENAASIRLLTRLGMERVGRVQLAADDKELELFEMSL